MNTARPTTARRGFTLLEILIAVVVLAFGLLGIVAVYPAVIDLQRRAQDVVIGGASAASAEALFSASIFESGSLEWAEEFESDNIPFEDRFPLRTAIARDLALSSRGPTFEDDDATGLESVFVNFLWETSWSWDREAITAAASRGALLNEGTVVLGGGTLDGGLGADLSDQPVLELTVADRLLPDAASGADPQYVWDAVLRRVDAGFGVPSAGGEFVTKSVPLVQVAQQPVEVAIFVRRIDRGVRVPADLTLRDVLSGFEVDEDTGEVTELDEDIAAFPVSAVDDDLAQRRLGAARGFEGTVYSPPISLQVQRPRNAGPIDGDRAGPSSVTLVALADLVADGTASAGFQIGLASARESLAQVGQQFVDNLGVVHRVTAVREGGLIEVDPPLSSPGYRAKQIVFTPQVPVDIRVIRAR
ncbi:MAG: prepilin-type N-terminal cleavage/methylation domain-containing protein [Planctomycetota bacterium]